VSALPPPEPTGPGEESVWDYPRPPRLERSPARVEVVLGGFVIATTTAAWRVLETSLPPSYYVPRDAFPPDAVLATAGTSYCEWKGRASYWTLRAGSRRAEAAAWSYEHPSRGFEEIAGHLAVYAGKVDECRVDGEVVAPQASEFYGGWITRSVKGPFKGDPGTLGW
jgi:uncharacterized protein (DUF427 family)